MQSSHRQEQAVFHVIKPEQNPATRRQIKGEEYISILDKVRRIAYYQQMHAIKDGIRGFILYGDVGTGKTTCAKAVAAELGAPLVFIDGADIARPLYGQSEMQISYVFEEAKKYRYAVILIDDCESVFPTRDWAKAESWHIAQNNVFFHELDNIDAGKTLVILTTNRYDLLDKAVKDRLYSIEFQQPSKETLKEIAKFKCAQLRMEPDFAIAEIENKELKSVRELERLIMEAHIERIVKSDKGGAGPLRTDGY
ncbi:MAG: ATP-binding protein [Candidatus Subteraquimicrobiales bacterium]|nr:ATP-binding protein [Candidatus Subteraquimicrobiales bacterium]